LLATYYRHAGGSPFAEQINTINKDVATTKHKKPTA